MEKKQQSVRVIGCQGTIQLITATSVVLLNTRTDVNYKNYLLVYELYSPPGQELDFYRFIRNMAENGPLKFEKIVYLPADKLQEIEHEFSRYGLAASQKKLTSMIGLSHADELFLTSNWHPGNKIMMHCIPSGKRLCYGDSIGLFIPEGYFVEQTLATLIKKWKPINSLIHFGQAVKLFATYKARRPRFVTLKPRPFDVGYYLTLSLTQEIPRWPVHFTNRSSLISTFNQYMGCLPPGLFRDPIFRNSELCFLLTTNFSEARKMSVENEIQAYTAYLTRRVKTGGSVIIKPHPRDSKAKLQLLQASLSAHFQVKVLDEMTELFAPFELILIRLEAEDSTQVNRSKFHTFSSACLSLKILFGCDPEVGMGDELINRYFEPAHRPARRKHEGDLKRLLREDYS
jgi:hypothetical protein